MVLGRTLATKGSAALTGDSEDGGWRAGPGAGAMDRRIPTDTGDFQVTGGQEAVPGWAAQSVRARPGAGLGAGCRTGPRPSARASGVGQQGPARAQGAPGRRE